MTTKTAGGRITGLLALSCEALVALETGDGVMITGDYEVGLCDGTAPLLGNVSVANKAPVRGTATRPAEVPGPVTVEAIGFYVLTLNAGGAIPAGSPVGYNGDGDLVAVALGDPAERGVALTGTTGIGQKLDVLFR